MSGFPSLKPAMTFRVTAAPEFPVSSMSRGTPLLVVPIAGGTLKAEPSFEPAIDAEVHGVVLDYIRSDAAGGHLRLDARAQLKTKNGELLAIYYKGTVAVTAEVQKVVSRAPDATTTNYGHLFATFEFETGSEKYKALETTSFAAAGHYVVEEELWWWSISSARSSSSEISGW